MCSFSCLGSYYGCAEARSLSPEAQRISVGLYSMIYSCTNLRDFESSTLLLLLGIRRKKQHHDSDSQTHSVDSEVEAHEILNVRRSLFFFVFCFFRTPGIQYILLPGGPRSYTSKAWVPVCPLYSICELVLFSSGIRHHSLSHSNFCVTVVVGRKSAIAIPRTIFRLRHSLWLLSFIMLIDTADIHLLSDLLSSLCSQYHSI